MTLEGRWANELTEWDIVKVSDDFTAGTLSTLNWQTQLTDTGTAAIATGASYSNGVLQILPSDASVGNNDEAYVATLNPLFLPLLDNPIYFRCLLQYAEANTSDFNVGMGLQSTFGQNMLIDDGGGPQACTTGILIYKVDGGTNWQVQARNGSEVYTNTTLSPAGDATAGDAGYHLFEIFVHRFGAARVQVLYKMDGNFLKDQVTNKTVIHSLLVAAAAPCYGVVLCKNGSAGPVQTVNVDRLHMQRLR